MVGIILCILLIIVIGYSKYKVNFIIKESKHSSGIHFVPHLGVKRMDKTITFTDSCKYTSANKDWNKLFGFSYGHHHNTSFRIGWRFRNNKFETCLYFYINGERKERRLEYVTTDVEYRFIITVHDTKVTITYGVNGKELKSYDVRIEKINKKAGYYLFPYFGGQEVAPHKMLIKVKDNDKRII